MATYIDNRAYQIKQHMTQLRFVEMGKNKAGRRRERLIQIKDISTPIILELIKLYRPHASNLDALQKALPLYRRPAWMTDWNKVQGVNKLLKTKLKSLARMGLISIGENISLTELGHDYANYCFEFNPELLSKLSKHTCLEYKLMMLSLEREGTMPDPDKHAEEPWTRGHIKAALDSLDVSADNLNEVVMYLAGIAVGIKLVKPHTWE